MIWGGGKRQTPQHPKSVQFPPGQGLWRECWGSPCSAVEAFVKSARSLGMKFTPLQAFPYLEHPEWTPLSSPEHMAISCWTVTSQIAVTEKERSKRPKYRQPQWRAAQLTSCWSWTGAWVCGRKWSGLTARSGRAAGQCVGERWHKESFGKNSNILLAIWNSYLTHSQPKDCDWNSSQLSSVGFEFCQH